MRVLNLYAGLGGNRKLWEGVEVTAVELDEKIAEQYKKFYPDDTMIITDAHEYLLQNYQEYDYIWSSPPCQSHSKMSLFGKNRKPRYPDLKLYEEVILLKTYFKGNWVIENVKPFYSPLIAAKSIGRHMFWSNYQIPDMEHKGPTEFINATSVVGSQLLKDWLGIQYDGNIYYWNNHCPSQVLRNCVHPDVGKAVFDARLNKIQAGLFL